MGDCHPNVAHRTEVLPARANYEIWWLEGVKKSGLPQALAKRSLIRNDLDDARPAVLQ